MHIDECYEKATKIVGFQGMALGQAIDLESEGKAVSLDALKAMHAKKTGALITASLLMGAACGEPHACLRTTCSPDQSLGIDFSSRAEKAPCAADRFTFSTRG